MENGVTYDHLVFVKKVYFNLTVSIQFMYNIKYEILLV